MGRSEAQIAQTVVWNCVRGSGQLLDMRYLWGGVMTLDKDVSTGRELFPGKSQNECLGPETGDAPKHPLQKDSRALC